jgi:hypothetical protein
MVLRVQGHGVEMKRALFALLCFVVPTTVRADSQAEIDAAKRGQGPAIQRAMQAMDAYAKSLNLDPMFVSYCRGEMELHTYSYPVNGNYMFGFNYNTSTSVPMIQAAISFRAQYETSYVMLCLAKVKKTLDEAHPKQ